MTVGKSGTMEQFEAIFDAKVCCIFAKVRENVLFGLLQPKQT